jgi:flagellar biosynthetic protein FlhB
MADAPDRDQKTHAPTDKRLADAREKGNLPAAPEMRHAAIFAAALVVAGGLGVWTFARIGRRLLGFWGAAEDIVLDSHGAANLAGGLIVQTGLLLAPLLGVTVAAAVAAGFAAGMPTISWTRVAPKWSKLSPVAGAGRLFGARALTEFAKTLAKLGAVAVIAMILVWPQASGLERLVGADPVAVAGAAGGLAVTLLKAVALLVGAVAAADLLYQRRSWLKKLMMSLQEIKDEHKQNEGDPKIKAKIRAIGIQRSRRRMMAAVPTASVVITNPTHYAVALRYDHGSMAAPVVVAKGVDAVALRIREVATDAGVPLVENRPLARALHAAAELDRPIPVEHYAAVAEVIGYVMRLEQSLGARARG